MTVNELLSQLHNLSRGEKLKVIKFLVNDLETEDLDFDDLMMSESVVLSSQDWQEVTGLIENPPLSNSALLSAVERYKKEVIS
jgi:hypothetical protein